MAPDHDDLEIVDDDDDDADDGDKKTVASLSKPSIICRICLMNGECER